MKAHKFYFMGILCLAFLCGCKKDKPVIVGNWKLTNLQATSVYNNINLNSPGESDTIKTVTTVTYNNLPGVLSYVETGTQQYSASYLYTLQMNVQSNGSVTLNETDTASGMQDNKVTTGNWNYMAAGSGAANAEVTFNTIGASLLAARFLDAYEPAVMEVTSLTTNNMTLVYSRAESGQSPYYVNNSSVTLTFSR